ncbi:MAG TPA: hypothetical protein VKZ18_12125 [Polyangia bacterium]|nr:hypothetical protein [Polyangia bacterium]
MATAHDTIACESKSRRTRLEPLLVGVGLVALAMFIAAPAAAQEATAPPPAVAPPPPMATMPPPVTTPDAPAPRMVGGHIGVAVPLVSFHHLGKTTQTPSDQLTLAVPIGVTVHMSPDWVVDFEEIVGSPVRPAGFTGVTIDPGVVYVGGPVALGLRLKWDIGSNVNVGLIPLIHKALVDIGGGANWFIEGAFPLTYSRIGAATTVTGAGANDYTLAIVLHTGVAF